MKPIRFLIFKQGILHSYAVPALLTLDTAGILMRWCMFDHFVRIETVFIATVILTFASNRLIWEALL